MKLFSLNDFPIAADIQHNDRVCCFQFLTFAAYVNDDVKSNKMRIWMEVHCDLNFLYCIEITSLLFSTNKFISLSCFDLDNSDCTLR